MPLFALPIIDHRHINNLEKVLLFNVNTFNMFRLEAIYVSDSLY